MSLRWLRPAFLLIAASCASGAAAADAEGAKAIARGYADYFGSVVVDKGIVSVAPDGDHYVVAWDLQKAIDLAGAPDGELRIERFSYTLTPGRNGAWTVEADRFPRIVVDAATDPGRLTGVIDFSGFRLETVYDAAATDFLRAVAAVDRVATKLHGVDAEGEDLDVDETGVSLEARAKTSANGAGVDVALAHSAKGLNETIVVPPTGGGAPVKMTYTVGGVAGSAAIVGLRAREIGDLWRYAVAHADGGGAIAELTRRARAALPFWNEVQASGEVHDLTLRMPLTEATLRTLHEKLDLSGLVADGVAELGVRIDSLAVRSPMLPAWAGSLSPASLDLDLRLVDRGLDEAARLVLDDPNFGRNGQDISAETRARISRLLLAGDPKLIVLPGRLTTPMLDLTFEGSVSAAAATSAPTAHFSLSADGLDKTIALLGEIADGEPEMRPAVLVATFAKGLAKTTPDGRLAWEVDVSEAGAVTVNGQAMPTGK